MALTRVKHNQVDTKSQDSAIDADLRAIGELPNTKGYLAKVSNNSWALVDINTVDVKTALVGSGAVIQTVSAIVPATSGSTILAIGNTLPAKTNGVQVWSRTISPHANTSKIAITGSFSYGSSTANRQLMAFLFRENTCIATTGAFTPATASTTLVPVMFDVVDSPATTHETTYSVRVAGTYIQLWYINQFSTSGRFSNTLATSSIKLQELA